LKASKKKHKSGITPHPRRAYLQRGGRKGGKLLRATPDVLNFNIGLDGMTVCARPAVPKE
jgi:hypothetical protein